MRKLMLVVVALVAVVAPAIPAHAMESYSEWCGRSKEGLMLPADTMACSTYYKMMHCPAGRVCLFGATADARAHFGDAGNDRPAGDRDRVNRDLEIRHQESCSDDSPGLGSDCDISVTRPVRIGPFDYYVECSWASALPANYPGFACYPFLYVVPTP